MDSSSVLVALLFGSSVRLSWAEPPGLTESIKHQRKTGPLRMVHRCKWQRLMKPPGLSASRASPDGSRVQVAKVDEASQVEFESSKRQRKAGRLGQFTDARGEVGQQPHGLKLKVANGKGKKGCSGQITNASGNVWQTLPGMSLKVASSKGRKQGRSRQFTDVSGKVGQKAAQVEIESIEQQREAEAARSHSGLVLGYRAEISWQQGSTAKQGS
ncbi:hypothetical protein NDU88_004813 [Pleurodeles waltl]|uniref:Uncharacterized protein n=1 Tax=Pleurodeles waltl TaxID=8319 RepID=A0AAV7TTS7_PLEWA|nr:hypothetical protein NDU88_004813 [Pleurodeles waltl]